MILNRLTINNYKNIEEADLTFSPKLNCLIGNNGMGKTNILDAIYYLSMCRSSNGVADGEVVLHGAPQMMLQGSYSRRGIDETVTVSVQPPRRKVLRRGGKDYRRLSQHIGLLPVVMVSPLDSRLITGAGEERRRFMDHVISQQDHAYLDAVIRYGKALEQRNSMLRHEMRDAVLYESVEAILCESASIIFQTRARWLEEFTPTFMRYYVAIAGEDEGSAVHLDYLSSLHTTSMAGLLAESRERDLVLGYTGKGVHRDDLDLLLDGHSMRRIGSQGQCRTYTMALRLAQYAFMREVNPTTPVLLLDDIFDRLDARRVERIVDVVSTEGFGQIFITDTNRTHLDRIVASSGSDHRMFTVSHGRVTADDEVQEGGGES